jgi:hypothetical protein
MKYVTPETKQALSIRGDNVRPTKILSRLMQHTEDLPPLLLMYHQQQPQSVVLFQY